MSRLEDSRLSAAKRPYLADRAVLSATRIVLSLLAPIWRRLLQRRLARGKESTVSIAQKLVQSPAPRPPGPLVWGHAVGVGEAQALVGLFAVLGEHLPSHHFLVTSSARTSGQALARGLPPRCLHQFAPIDTPTAVARFLGHWRPSLAVWCEMDLWPLLVAETARRGVPMALVNARVEPSSLAARQRLRPFYAAVLRCYDTLWAQNDDSARALVALGAPSARVRVSATVKTLARPLPCDESERELWRARVGHRPVWLGASTHPGEESLLLAAHERLRRTHPQALLILAPRLPARGAEVAGLAAGAATRRRATGETPEDATSVYVADTIGEMGLWYRVAHVAFVGGSVAPVGGHNPFEPLALGCAVLHGPRVDNFSESYRALDAEGLALRADDPAAIEAAVAAAWRTGRQATAERWERSPLRHEALALVQALQHMAESGLGT